MRSGWPIVVGAAIFAAIALTETHPPVPPPQTLVCVSGSIEVEWRTGDAHVACVIYAHDRRVPSVIYYDPHDAADIVRALDPLP